MNCDDSALSSLSDEDDYQGDNGRNTNRDNIAELGELKKDILYYFAFRLSIGNTLIHGLLKKPSHPPSLAEDENDEPLPKRLAFHTKQLIPMKLGTCLIWTATAGSDVVQSGRPIFDGFFQHLWPYIGNNTENVIFQMVKRLWLIRIDQ
ncbi:hypothetical protein TNCV_1263251 [Trichonephila clavipes]|nr:hypothetical protein TNCV_1263251 [Trichonephila clavipes]